MITERKGVAEFELKGDSSGELEAVFSTFNVVDHDGDITLPTAFKDGSEVIIGAFGHQTSQLPIGKGTIRVSPSEARVTGRLFLDTTPGAEAYRTLKGLGALAQWSFVFEIEKSDAKMVDGKRVRVLEQLKVFSVDPVLAGAGINTRTTRLKGQHGGGVLTAEDRADLAEIKAENERRIIRAELGAQRAKFGQFQAERKAAEMRPVDRMNIHPLVRIPAQKAMERAAQQLGIPAVEVKWFDRPSWSTERFQGYTDVTDPAIWVIATATADEAAWIAYHEMKHRSLGLGQRPSDEWECNRFADEMIAARQGTCTGLY